jgi:hypothetical protein
MSSSRGGGQHGLQARIDPIALAFAVGIALVSSVVCGLAPALHASRHDLNAALRDGDPPRRGRIYELVLPAWHEVRGSKLRAWDFLWCFVELFDVWRRRVKIRDVSR